MPEPFEKVPEPNVVFRLVSSPSSFLPAGVALPLPDWFVPTETDVKAADARGRPAGWSVFDVTRASVGEVRALLSRPDDVAFGCSVAEIKAIGAKWARVLEVVYQPLEARAPTPGWDAHALIEGLRRVPPVEKKNQRQLLTELSSSFRRVE